MGEWEEFGMSASTSLSHTCMLTHAIEVKHHCDLDRQFGVHRVLSSMLGLFSISCLPTASSVQQGRPDSCSIGAIHWGVQLQDLSPGQGWGFKEGMGPLPGVFRGHDDGLLLEDCQTRMQRLLRHEDLAPYGVLLNAHKLLG